MPEYPYMLMQSLAYRDWRTDGSSAQWALTRSSDSRWEVTNSADIRVILAFGLQPLHSFFHVPATASRFSLNSLRRITVAGLEVYIMPSIAVYLYNSRFDLVKNLMSASKIYRI
jgi:hypothetical protein